MMRKGGKGRGKRKIEKRKKNNRKQDKDVYMYTGMARKRSS